MTNSRPMSVSVRTNLRPAFRKPGSILTSVPYRRSNTIDPLPLWSTDGRRFSLVTPAMKETCSDTTRELKHVTIYTDGACVGNPGPGGYGVILLYGAKRREISGGFRHTTNNRMEIMAAIAGLEALRYKCAVTIYTDSQYLADSIMKGWAERWRANGWKRNRKEKAVNVDLWMRLLRLCARHDVRFEWLKGHAGDRENERCDFLSTQAAQGTNLPADEGYENNHNQIVESELQVPLTRPAA